jgi:hypothetical protein
MKAKATAYYKLTDEQKRKYNQANYQKKKARREANNQYTVCQNMLAMVIGADNADTKRELISKYNPFHYIFGTALVRITQEDLLTDVNADNEGDNHE